ncbi:MAG: folylpolyglutamate synthase/dihydrofolate synthase family protein [Ginsengibacter sp.]
MNYEQTLHYLYNKLPLYSNIGLKAYKADLKNTITLCNFLNNPQEKIKTIHVAGTNGKGSTSHMLAAIFQQAGYKTGLYTSPHLTDFRERIKVNGEMISQEFVIDFVEKTKVVSEEISPSFFELTFVMAMEYFAQQQTEIAIIETGLGGRLDSTNVITPELSIITNISFDHMDILGDTLEKIALEKAGIIKPGVPVIIGEATAETKKVFIDKAKDVAAPIYFSSDKYEIKSVVSTIENLTLEVNDIGRNQKENFTLDLNGLYQKNNLLTVLTAIDVIKKEYLLQEDDVKRALSNVKKLTGLHGRWELIHKDPAIILDVAHNEDGIKNLVKQISLSTYNKLHIIIGMVKDKEAEKVLVQLPSKAIYYFTKAQIPRALPEYDLLAKAKNFHLEGAAYPTVNVALKSAMAEASKEDMILVCGSVFIVGEVEF